MENSRRQSGQQSLHGILHKIEMERESGETREGSHDSVCRSSPALRHRPLDVLLGHLDAAALAVHAVLRVDDEAALPLLV